MSLTKTILELYREGRLQRPETMRLLEATRSATGANSEAAPGDDGAVAIIGAAGRFPEAEDLDAFWHNLASGRDSVGNVPADRLPPAEYLGADHPGLGYGRWGAFLDGIYDFDPESFELRREEAAALDPQQRLVMMVAQHALDDAGYRRAELAGSKTGIFVGARMNQYGWDYFRSLRDLEPGQRPEIPFSRAALLGRSQNFMAAWLSDRFDLRGPSLVLDTACSSSLTALHLACRSLADGDSELALVGGVDLLLDPLTYVMLSQAKALSPEGRCFTFDRRANGYVPGEGCGVLLLKGLAAARRDGDRVLAVVRASAVNNDGKTVGITTPSLEAQIRLLETLYGPEGVHPESVGYVEAHGTGTAIGDPIELKALTEVFRRHTDRSAFCGLGSVKTNIGHLHSAAGIASVIKAMLCLRHGALPPTLHCQEPNPRFELASSPFYLNLGLRDWPRGEGPRRIGVSGFGFGGTNAHVILEEAPEEAPEEAAEKTPEKTGARRSPRPRTVFNLVPCRLPSAPPAAAAAVAAPAPAPRGERPHPLIDTARASAGGATFERTFSLDDVFLRDHLVLGVPMIPGVTWFEFLRAGAEAAGLPPVTGFLNVTFLKPLHLGPKGRERVRGTIDGDGAFTVTAGGEGSRASLLVRGRMVLGGSPPPPPPFTPPALPLGPRLAGEEVYDALRGLGYLHGGFFQNIGWMTDAGPRETFAWLRRGQRPQGWAERLALDPGLLDSATIVAFGSESSTAVRSGGNPFIPIFFGAVHVYGALADEVYVDTRIHVWNEEMCRCTQVLADAEGRVRLVFEDLASKRVPAGGFAGAEALDPDALARLDAAAVVAAADHARRSQAQREASVARLEAWTRSAALGSPQESSASVPVTLPEVAAEPAAALSGPEAAAGLEAWLSRMLGVALEPSALATPFLSLGLDSAHLVSLVADLEQTLGLELYPTILFEEPTPGDFLAYLRREHSAAVAAFEAAAPAAPAAAAGATPATAEPPTREEPGPEPAGARAVEEPALTEPTGRAPAIHVPAPPAGEATDPESTDYPAVAVIGMAGRYPGAPDLEAFWRLLAEGRDLVGEIPAERWDWRRYFDPKPGTAGKTYSRWGAFLDGVGDFDPSFFGIAPRDAAELDPQLRLFLETAWATLENAGYAAAGATPQSTGVFVGYSHDHYYEQRLHAGVHHLRGLGVATSVANQLSYLMDWRGPSVVVNTLCSSSLVAVHQAVRALHLGECEVALAGGVHAALCPEYYVAMSHQRALSPSGRCRTFDAAADGYVPGEGVGAVLLKPLHRALADGDAVHAVIRGSAVNHAGRASRSTAPNPAAQTAVIRRALDAAGLEAGAISYVETHGTGTALGDPIEVGALARAFDDGSARPGGCVLGALKSQIGHLESAAGIAGLHKVILALQHRQLPPTLHVAEPNPALRLDGSPFRLAQGLAPWSGAGLDAGPRRAGLSSFGMLGVNAHLILEEAPAAAVAGGTGAPGEPGAPGEHGEPREHGEHGEREQHVLALSARSEEELRAWAATLAAVDADDAATPHLCFSVNTGRKRQGVRLTLPLSRWSEARDTLAAIARGEEGAPRPAAPRRRPKTAFLFSGQGSQYPAMARGLYRRQPTFRAALERCDALLAEHLETPLLSILFDGDEGVPGARAIDQTGRAQPALFAVSYALTELWRSWGVTPDAVLGHSVGELVAAVVAGALSLEEGCALVAARGRRMQSLDPEAGAMTAVLAPRERFEAILARFDGLDVAAYNGPENTVVSGCRRQSEELRRALKEAGVRCAPLQVSHAFHSRLMAPIEEAFRRTAEGFTYRAPRLPWISNVTGRIVSEAPDADYWVRHLRSPVRFEEGLRSLAGLGVELLLEAGPHPTLSGLAVKVLGEGVPALPSMRRGEAEETTLATTAARLEMAGHDLDWQRFDEGFRRSRRPLPASPRQRQRYWLERRDDTAGAGVESAAPVAKLHAVPPAQPSLRPAPAAAAEVQNHPLFDEIPAPRPAAASR